MERNQAIELLKSTLNAPYDEYKFSNLAINFLNDLNSSNATGVLSEDYLKPNFKNHILQYKRLGSYTDAEGESIDVLTVQLKNEWALERSRGVLRNFAADYIKNNSQGNAALVAYYTNNLEDWRFSYIRLDYSLEKSDSGKVKVREDLTPAKRYSYLVGLNEPNHTAQEQILPLLESDKKPTIDEIENAFKVDALSKLFYQEYRELYEDLTKEIIRIIDTEPLIETEFENNNIQPDNFAKKLMGQIVFLYFIQKKGWLGVKKDSDWGSGEKRFLQQLFKNHSSNNFYIDVLEPLFYEALAKDRQGDYYSKLDCRIPFLSGGLFEPMNDFDWINVKVPIEDRLIRNIFSKFDQYNFTVRESDPIEVDVAIDPEMLGRVFENLLPENIRKGKGAYYTPRTIVHYMCQESLINYLDTECKEVPKNDLETLIREGDLILELETEILEEKKTYQSFLMESINNNAQSIDDALSNIKVCDPAIGSGAFPVGMLHEIVKARKVLELYLKKEETTYTLKRHCIQESIYGVDIDPGSIDIAKLRLWLSLVVDEEDYNNIQTLPNLDYKIMQGNSLIDEFHGVSLNIREKKEINWTSAKTEDVFSGGEKLDDLIKDLYKKQTSFFNAQHPNDKKKKREAVETAIFNIFHNELEKKRSISPQETQEIEAELKEMTHGNKVRNFFPWKLYFADVFREKDGFDVVIANPPYGAELSDGDKTEFKKIYSDVHLRTPDTIKYFISRSIKLLKKRGLITFIVSNNLLFQNEYSKVRHLLISQRLLSVVNLGDNIFESAIVPSCIFIGKNIEKNNYSFDYLDIRDTKSNDFGKLMFYPYQSEDILNSPSFVFGISKHNLNIIEKVRNLSWTINDIATEVASGIGTGGDKIFKIHKVDTTYFKNERDILKPVLIGRDIDSYKYCKSDNFIIYTNKRVNIKKYPLVYSYLLPFKDKLSKKRETKKGTLPWWCLHWPRNKELFIPNKIIMRQTSDKIRATIDNNSFFTLDSIIILKIDAKYKLPQQFILGIINSRLSNFIYKNITQETGRLFAQVKPQNVRKLFIPKSNENYHGIIINLVNQILTAKKANPKADTSDLESEIDQLVYELYGLTEDEIAIVEESIA